MTHLRHDLKGIEGDREARSRAGGWPKMIGLVGLSALFFIGLGNVAQANVAAAVDAHIAGQVLTVEGTNRDDQIVLRLKAGDANVLEVDVNADGTADFSFDRALFAQIELDAQSGNDLIRVDESNGPIDEPTSIFAGNGNDSVFGGSANETIQGGPGNDFIDGNRGADIAFMDEGNDTFRWDPGDASDVVEGGRGRDTLLFNGANVAENVDLSANGERLRFFRLQANITMDVNEVEVSVFNALGGADTITVNDLTGTGVTQVNLNLDNPLGTGTADGQADRVIVNGAAGNDRITVTGRAGNANVTGLSAAVAIRSAEVALDRLEINTMAGNDRVNTRGLARGVIQVFVNGAPV